MRGLLAGELRRVLARRLVRVLALLAVAGIALAGVLVFVRTEKVDAGQLAGRRRAAQQRIEACVRNGTYAPPELATESEAHREDYCRLGPPAQVRDARFKLRELKGVLQGTTAPLVVVAWLIGASVIGADWQSRTVTTLLTWEPRRVRVLLAKALACIAVAAVFAVLTEALLGAALLPSALVHGTTAGTGSTWLRSVAGVVLRGTALVSIATAVGFAVASVGRNTAAALGLGFAYFVVIENVVGSFIAGFRRWLLLGNAIVLVSGKDQGGEVAGRSVLGAGLFLTAVALALLAGAALIFQRRDVA